MADCMMCPTNLSGAYMLIHDHAVCILTFEAFAEAMSMQAHGHGGTAGHVHAGPARYVGLSHVCAHQAMVTKHGHSIGCLAHLSATIMMLIA